MGQLFSYRRLREAQASFNQCHSPQVVFARFSACTPGLLDGPHFAIPENAPKRALAKSEACHPEAGGRAAGRVPPAKLARAKLAGRSWDWSKALLEWFWSEAAFGSFAAFRFRRQSPHAALPGLPSSRQIRLCLCVCVGLFAERWLFLHFWGPISIDSAPCRPPSQGSLILLFRGHQMHFEAGKPQVNMFP